MLLMVSITAVRNSRDIGENRAGSNFPKILEALGHQNSSRLEFSKKNLHSVIYEGLGSHSHGFSMFLENSSRLEFS